MTITEAREQMERARREIPDAVRAGLEAAGESAAEAIRRDWPVDSGESRDGWQGDQEGVRNDVPHTPYVHDGLADELAPRALREAETVFATVVEQRIDSAAGW